MRAVEHRRRPLNQQRRRTTIRRAPDRLLQSKNRRIWNEDIRGIKLYLVEDNDRPKNFILFAVLEAGLTVFTARILPNGAIKPSSAAFLRGTLFLMPEWGTAVRELGKFLTVHEVMDS